MKTFLTFFALISFSIFSNAQMLDSIGLYRDGVKNYKISYHYASANRLAYETLESYKNGEVDGTSRWEYAYNDDKLVSFAISSYDTIALVFDTSSVVYYFYDSLGRETERKWYFEMNPDFPFLAHRENRTYNAAGLIDTFIRLYYSINDTTQFRDGERKIYHYVQSNLIAVEYASAYFPPVFTRNQMDSIFYTGNKISQVKKYSIQNDSMASSFYSLIEYHYDNQCPDRLSHFEEVLAQGQIRLVDSFYYYRSDCLLDSLGSIDRVPGPNEAYDTFYQVYYYYDTSTGISQHSTVVKAQMRLYPNPARAYIILSGYIPENETGARIEFYDMQGRVVKTEILKKGLINQSISTREFTMGVYAYRVYSSQANIATGRIFIEP